MEKLLRSRVHTLDNYNERYGEEVGLIKFNEYKSKCVLYSVDGKSNQIGYWLKQGYSEQQARLAVSERQSTFSLAKCIEKYGEVEGLNIFNSRQEKWQNSLKDKSPEEIERINRDKGTNKQGIPHKGGITLQRILDDNMENHSCTLYYVKIGKLYKIGITTNTIKSRFGLMYNDITLIKSKTGNLLELFLLEQTILDLYHDFRVTRTIGRIKSTEFFNKNIFGTENEENNNYFW